MQSTPQWLQPFGAQFCDAVMAQVREGRAGKLACFDADGTLWGEDIGEAFFRWLAAGALLTGEASARDPFQVWEDYEARVKRNRSEGYAWAVQCMAGLQESDVRRWCRQMAVAWPNYRPAMLGLVRGLAASGFEVWLVSASNAWIISATAPIVGLEPANVMGIRVEVEQGKLTDRVVQPVTCNSGKVEAIQQRLGRLPDLAVGDSMGDREMLESAKQALVVGRRDKPGAEMVERAKGKGWPVELF